MGVTQGPKYMLQKVVPKWRLWNLSDPAKYGKGPIGALKNAYGEQPTVCLCLFLGLLGAGKMVWAYYENEKTGFLDNKAYKRYYTVMRPDDARIVKFQEDWFENGLPPTTSARARL